jgi:hypothetical protein
MDDLTTTSVRLAVFVTVTADTTVTVDLFANEYGVAAGAATYFWGAQLEVGVTKVAPLCATTTAAKTCR